MSDRSSVKWKIATYCVAAWFGCEAVGVCAAPKAALSQDSPVAAQGDELPDPVAILKSVREMQASIRQTLQGRLRRGGRTVGYRMVMEGLQVRFEFPEAVSYTHLTLPTKA